MCESQWVLAPCGRCLFSVFAWRGSRERGAGSVPHKRDGAGGGCICLPPPGSRRCRRAHPSLWDLPEFPTPAPQNQAASGSSLVPRCGSVSVYHFGIKFQVNLKEEIAVHVGWVDLSVGYAQASSLGKAQGEAIDGLSCDSTVAWQETADPASCHAT